jgi:hypothetical protein
MRFGLRRGGSLTAGAVSLESGAARSAATQAMMRCCRLQHGKVGQDGCHSAQETCVCTCKCKTKTQRPRVAGMLTVSWRPNLGVVRAGEVMEGL